MLKLFIDVAKRYEVEAAAFGRLCVETEILDVMFKLEEAAAFGRLCVETFIESQIDAGEYAAAFGRLCVETIMRCKCRHLRWGQSPSGGCVLKQKSSCFCSAARIAAAFGRLCVETTKEPIF